MNGSKIGFLPSKSTKERLYCQCEFRTVKCSLFEDARDNRERWRRVFGEANEYRCYLIDLYSLVRLSASFGTNV